MKLSSFQLISIGIMKRNYGTSSGNLPSSKPTLLGQMRDLYNIEENGKYSMHEMKNIHLHIQSIAFKSELRVK